MCPDAPLSGPDDLCQDDALQNGAVLQEFLNFLVICGLVRRLVAAEQSVHCDIQAIRQPDQHSQTGRFGSSLQMADVGDGEVRKLRQFFLDKAFGYGQHDSVPFASLRLVDGDDVGKSQSGQWVHALSTPGRCAASVTRYTI